MKIKGCPNGCGNTLTKKFKKNGAVNLAQDCYHCTECKNRFYILKTFEPITHKK